MTPRHALTRLGHKIAHLLKWNFCEQVDWHNARGDHLVGGRCVTCGYLHWDTVVNFGELARQRHALTGQKKET